MIQDLEFNIDLKRKTISKEYCKQNDTLNLIFNVYDDGQAVDLTGFTAILNCRIGDKHQVIKNDDITITGNKIIIFDKDKYITTMGENATVEIVLSKDNIQKTSFNISLEVDKSVLNTTGHLEEVVITALANLQDDLNKASATVQKLEEENTKANNNTNSLSTENTRAETNYNNLKNVNDNLSDLVEANTTATTNINNLTTENNKAAANIEAMQGFGDVTNLAQQVETNKENIAEITTQLNEKVNKSSIINNCSTTEEGFALDARQGKVLNDAINDIVFKSIVVNPNGNDYVDISIPEIPRGSFVIGTNGDASASNFYIVGVVVTEGNIKFKLNESKSDNIRINFIYTKTNKNS